MGFRFRKSFKIAPGVRINLSKSGVSTSLGGKGVTANFSKRGTRTTVGIPGSGLSYSHLEKPRAPVADQVGADRGRFSLSTPAVIVLLVVLVIVMYLA